MLSPTTRVTRVHGGTLAFKTDAARKDKGSAASSSKSTMRKELAELLQDQNGDESSHVRSLVQRALRKDESASDSDGEMPITVRRWKQHRTEAGSHWVTGKRRSTREKYDTAELTFRAEEYEAAASGLSSASSWCETSTRRLCQAVGTCGQSFHVVADRLQHPDPRACESWFYEFASALLQHRERRLRAIIDGGVSEEQRHAVSAAVELLRRDPLYKPEALNALDLETFQRLQRGVTAAKNVDVAGMRRRELLAEAQSRVEACENRLAKEPSLTEAAETAREVAWNVAGAVDEIRAVRDQLRPSEANGEYVLVDHPAHGDRRHRQIEVHLEAAVDDTVCCPHPAIQRRVDAARMLLAANGALHRALRSRQSHSAQLRRAEEAVAELEADVL
eukprot:CAMPEP_0174850602 /NCGR_PEP_ID=MMETSP1114-20130205/20335_1 /TAXON_ID=312471 /ORGANISM="Neobodo designis, Strain CCAP 1951/1" /LENGTH=390 /DNA_ID=CAMNT_0016085071 /DNA_START=29 /DNA_END=1197 /DNA_ORIENTATION=-